MKVKIEFTVDVDPAAWSRLRQVYGPSVRGDVKREIEVLADEHLRTLGVLVPVPRSLFSGRDES